MSTVAPTRFAFRDYLIAENKTGSNKAASYLRVKNLTANKRQWTRRNLISNPPPPTPCFYSREFAFIRGSNTIPELCIASPIIRWAECNDTRMDPRNGICLSATYDKAFDNYLITLDEDYRRVVSKEIRDHYRNDHARELFEKREGQEVLLPENYGRWPLQGWLEEHSRIWEP